MGASKYLSKIFAGLINLTGYVGGILCGLIMVLLCCEVIFRKLFDRPTIWALDLSTLSLFFASILPAAWVLKRGGHVRIDFIYAFVRSKKLRRSLDIFTSIISLCACGIFVWQGIAIWYSSYIEQSLLYRTLTIPMFCYLWAFPVGFLLLCIQIVINLKESFK